ncbi:MAG TPA: hypothetical protein VN688_20400, partial [Gemmataceae bacterium]|nr:hypothetical protein [Gemmataceae bacterium]
HMGAPLTDGRDQTEAEEEAVGQDQTIGWDVSDQTACQRHLAGVAASEAGLQQPMRAHFHQTDQAG